MLKEPEREGTLGEDYAGARVSKRPLRYRLNRRTAEVICAIAEFAPPPIERILDLGTADGRMLHSIRKRFPGARCVGLELSPGLLRILKAHFASLQVIQADIHDLAFSAGQFDVVVLAAVIEHVRDPGQVVREVSRVLKKGGILVLTSPDPFWERLATRLGHLKKGQHQQVMKGTQLGELMERQGLSVIKSEKFMISPIGMPFERRIEEGFRRLGLPGMLANQILVGRRD